MRSRLMQLLGHVGIMTTLLTLLGCVTIKPQPLPPQRTKAELERLLSNTPAEGYLEKKVTSKKTPLPHSADEMWIWHYPDSTEYRYYFQGNTLIAIDHVIYETL